VRHAISEKKKEFDDVPAERKELGSVLGVTSLIDRGESDG
jgi:hypothetical protein